MIHFKVKLVPPNTIYQDSFLEGMAEFETDFEKKDWNLNGKKFKSISSSNNGEVSCFQERFIPNISHQLDFDAMKRACELFKGKHDFQNYYCQGSAYPAPG